MIKTRLATNRTIFALPEMPPRQEMNTRCL